MQACVLDVVEGLSAWQRVDIIIIIYLSQQFG
jgi:hypothetical protein